MHYEGSLHQTESHKKVNMTEKSLLDLTAQKGQIVQNNTAIHHITVINSLLKGKPSCCGTTALHN